MTTQVTITDNSKLPYIMPLPEQYEGALTEIIYQFKDGNGNGLLQQGADWKAVFSRTPGQLTPDLYLSLGDGLTVEGNELRMKFINPLDGTYAYEIWAIYENNVPVCWFRGSSIVQGRVDGATVQMAEGEGTVVIPAGQSVQVETVNVVVQNVFHVGVSNGSGGNYVTPGQLSEAVTNLEQQIANIQNNGSGESAFTSAQINTLKQIIQSFTS